jgi:hypothetical protein
MADISSNPISCLVKTTAIIFVVLFVTVTPLVLLVFNIELLLLKPDLYKDALLEQGFYERLPILVGGQLVQGMTYDPCEVDPGMCEGDGQTTSDAEEGGPTAYMAIFDEEDWAYLISSLLPQSWLQAQTEGVIDQVFAYLDGDRDELVLKISMTGFKQNLDDQKKDEIIRKLLEDSPPCTEEELVEIAELLLGGEEAHVPVCMSPDELLTPLMGEMDATLSIMLSDVPDEVTFTPSGFSGEDEGEGLDMEPIIGQLIGDNPLAVLRFLRQGFLFSPLLSLALLALIAIFGIRSFRGLLRWWGIPLLLVGVLVILPVFSAIPIINWTYENLLISRIPGYLTHDMVGVFLGILRSIGGRFALWVGLQAGLMAMLGFFLVVVSLFLREKKSSDVQMENY